MKKIYLFFSILILLFSPFSLEAQEDCTDSSPIQMYHPVFDDAVIPRIDITLSPIDFEAILTYVQSNEEYPATFIFYDGIETTIVENVGFRLRGNTSRGSAKKSFKVSFNSFEAGKKFHGLEKLNLNGEHNDPSIVRSKLCWDILGAMDVVGSRANHVELYVNNEYRGLYINVEHIDEEFTQDRYGAEDGGNLYKCLWPADLNYLGDSPEDYKEEQNGRRTYDLKTNTDEDDYSDLANFIILLNESPDSEFKVAISEIFDVDIFLRILAADVFMANWDGYSFNKNNFYLYSNPISGKIEFIDYDLDNTFGIDWFGVDWGTRNIYDWTSSFNNNVLTDRILEVPEYRDRYSYYLQKLVNGYAHPDHIFPIIDCLHNQLTPFAAGDVYRTLDYGFTMDNFHQSYNEPLWGHVTYGIKPYISTRRNSILEQVQINDIPPIIRRVRHYPRTPRTDSPITFTALVEDDGEQAPMVMLHYRVNGSNWFTVEMTDDGTQNDATSNDGLYGAVVQHPNISPLSLLEYYVTSNDITGLDNREPLTKNLRIDIGGERPTLRINEFMVSNDEAVADEFGEFDDWVELYNYGEKAVFLGDKYLTDNLGNPDKWRLPNVELAPQDFVVIWADGQTEQGDFHASFKLSKAEESIGLFDSDESGFAPIDELSYQNLETDIAYGLAIDGEGDYTALSAATPNASNMSVAIEEQEQYQDLIEVSKPYPNPFSKTFAIDVDLKEAAFLGLNVYSIIGKKMEVIPLQLFQQGNARLEVNMEYYPKGLYFPQLEVENKNGKKNYLPLLPILLN